jgi:hypothetical protein
VGAPSGDALPPAQTLQTLKPDSSVYVPAKQLVHEKAESDADICPKLHLMHAEAPLELLY